MLVRSVAPLAFASPGERAHISPQRLLSGVSSRRCGEAQRLDQAAMDALLKAEAAFRKIGKPLPLFDRLDEEGR